MAIDFKDLCGWGPRDVTKKEHELFVCGERDRTAAAFATPFFIAGQTSSGAGKAVRLWKIYEKVTGKPYDTGTPQQLGDCFPAGTMVGMADGTEKPIEEISIGDMVLTHTGVKTKVTRLHSREYTGAMCTLKVENLGRAITATADHEFVEVRGTQRPFQEWSPVKTLSKANRILVPAKFTYRENTEVIDTHEVCGTDPNQTYHSGVVTSGCITDPDATRGKIVDRKNKIPRYIYADCDFAKLIGIYLAEGGADGGKLQFSFSTEETETLVAETQELLKTVFGLESSLLVRHENRSCTVVQCHSTALVQFMKALIPGNVYTKSVPPVIMRAPMQVRIECLRGWLEGDGSWRVINNFREQRYVGVTASDNLSLSMTRLSLGLGIRVSQRKRKMAVGRIRTCNDLSFSGDAVMAVNSANQRKVTYKRVDHGYAFRVRSNDVHHVTNEMVYCIEVEHEDHSFIANSYAVHNCVAAAMEAAARQLSCAEIADGQAERYRALFRMYHYGVGRVIIGKNRLRGGDGSVGSWQAQAVAQYGVISPEEIQNLPAYTKANGQAWGDDRKINGVSFRDFMTQGATRQIKAWSPVTAWEQLRDALWTRKAATIAGNRGYTMKADKSGFHRPSGNWNHQMHICGYSETAKTPWVAIGNQWGDVHGEVQDTEIGERFPKGVLVVTIDDFVKSHLKSSATECIVYSNFDGFPGHIDWSEFA